MCRKRGRGLGPARASEESAFTLLEVLVVMALVLIVLGAAAAALIGTANSAPRSALRAEEETEILRISSILRRQLITVARSSLSDTSLRGGTDEQGVPELEMTTASLVYSGGVGLAQWRIIRSPGEEPYLGYRELPYLGGEKTNTPDDYIPLSRMVRDMKVEFWSPPDWVEDWTRSEIPERVRVTMTFLSPSGEETFSVEGAPGIAVGSGDGASSSPRSPAPASPAPGEDEGALTPSPAGRPSSAPPLPPPPGAINP